MGMGWDFPGSPEGGKKKCGPTTLGRVSEGPMPPKGNLENKKCAVGQQQMEEVRNTRGTVQESGKPRGKFLRERRANCPSRGECRETLPLPFQHGRGNRRGVFRRAKGEGVKRKWVERTLSCECKEEGPREGRGTPRKPGTIFRANKWEFWVGSHCGESEEKAKLAVANAEPRLEKGPAEPLAGGRPKITKEERKARPSGKEGHRGTIKRRSENGTKRGRLQATNNHKEKKEKKPGPKKHREIKWSFLDSSGMGDTAEEKKTSRISRGMDNKF